MKLSELGCGCRGVISGNSFSGGMRRRLQDLGFSDGTVIECVGKSFLGSPCAYLVKGSVFALRMEDASKIGISLTNAFN